MKKMMRNDIFRPDPQMKWILNEYASMYGVGTIFENLSFLKVLIERVDLVCSYVDQMNTSLKEITSIIEKRSIKSEVCYFFIFF